MGAGDEDDRVDSEYYRTNQTDVKPECLPQDIPCLCDYVQLMNGMESILESEIKIERRETRKQITWRHQFKLKIEICWKKQTKIIGIADVFFFISFL